jgi:hypothetical protein
MRLEEEEVSKNDSENKNVKNLFLSFAKNMSIIGLFSEVSIASNDKIKIGKSSMACKKNNNQ